MDMLISNKLNQKQERSKSKDQKAKKKKLVILSLDNSKSTSLQYQKYSGIVIVNWSYQINICIYLGSRDTSMQ